MLGTFNTMASRRYIFLGIFLCICGITAGCVTASIAEISYGNGTLFITATNQDTTTQAVLQATVFRVQNFTQVEILKKAEFIQFESGTHEYQMPVILNKGTYKIYIYMTVNEDSKARVVRDLVV
ncbi:MAG: hypothetical protein LUP99_04895 [Methanomicrobiales archaeon]|nr:hypothetical protein [Methanomicrobiales archaeon]